MKKIILMFLILICTLINSNQILAFSDNIDSSIYLNEPGDPYIKTIYKSPNWNIIEVGVKGDFSEYYMKSYPHYFDNSGKNPKYGFTYLQIFVNNRFVYDSENSLLFFANETKGWLYIDGKKKHSIKSGTPIILNKEIINDMIHGKIVTIKIDFSDGYQAVHKFSLIGFTDAYKLLQKFKTDFPINRENR